MEPETSGRKRTFDDVPKEVELENEKQDQQFRFSEFDVDTRQWFATTLLHDEQGSCGWCYRHRYTGRPMVLVLSVATCQYTLYYQTLAEYGTSIVGMTTHKDCARDILPEQLGEVAILYSKTLGPVFGESEASEDAEEAYFLSLIDPSRDTTTQSTQERVIVKGKRSDVDNK